MTNGGGRKHGLQPKPADHKANQAPAKPASAQPKAQGPVEKQTP